MTKLLTNCGLTEMKFDELSNNMNIKLINGSGLHIYLIKTNLDYGKILQ